MITTTMMIRTTAPTPNNSTAMLMVVSLIGACTDSGGPGWTGEPAPGGSGAPGGAAGRPPKVPGGPAVLGAGGCAPPLRAVPTGGAGRLAGGGARTPRDL